MDALELQKMLQDVASGVVRVEEAQDHLQRLPFSDLGFARVDHHREVRQGMPEVVFGQGKTVQQLIGIVASLVEAGQNVLVTRVEAEKAALVQHVHPHLEYSRLARTLSYIVRPRPAPFAAPIAVVTAGTSDQAVAEEAVETLRVAGARVERYFDVGVAGVHRLLAVLPAIKQSPAVICVAGMEGALPSVLGGMIRAPVVAVPSSVGYGSALHGFTALLGMLTSCASGVTVVNIDNGFGAAMAVLRMSSLIEQGDPGEDSE